MSSYQVEMRWDCSSCGSRGQLGRYKSCSSCGNPRDKAEMRMPLPGESDPIVTDPDLLALALSGPDWFCTHCTAGNLGTSDKCRQCGAPRYGEDNENHPDERFQDEDDKFRASLPENEPARGYGALPDEGEASGRPKNARERAKEARRKIKATKRRADREEQDRLDEERRQRAERDHRLKIGAGLVLLALVAVFFIWAFQTHAAVGAVSATSWSRKVVIESWEDITVRRWQHQTSTKAEREPRDGRGESAGMSLIGDCRSEHYDDERYQCGTKQESYDCSTSKTESYQGTCTRTKRVKTGRTCSDNGNGFATCSDTYSTQSERYSCTKTRSVRVPKTCTRTVPKYCTREIYKDKCNYQTQEWQTSRTRTSSGSDAPHWPDYRLSPLERARRSSNYSIQVTYKDRGRTGAASISPGDEAEYLLWLNARTTSSDVYLKINNLGGVHSTSINPPQ